MESLLRELASICKCCAYADNLLLIVEVDFRADLERIGNKVLKVIDEWGQKIGVEISKKKSSTMLRKSTLVKSRPPYIRCSGVCDKG